MNYRKILSSIPLLIVPILILIFITSCKKDPALTEPADEKFLLTAKDLFNTKKMSTPCSGTESVITTYLISLDNGSVYSFSQLRCDENNIDTPIVNTFDWSDLQKNETDTTKIPEPVGPTFSGCPSGAVFDVNNMFHYSPNLTEVQRAVIQQVYDRVQYYNEYEYNGSYILADLDMYGYGSRRKLVYATVGYLVSSFLSDARFYSVVSNVPATYSAYNDCHEVRYKDACLSGISYFTTTSGGYGNPMSLNEAFNYFLNEIAAYRL